MTKRHVIIPELTLTDIDYNNGNNDEFTILTLASSRLTSGSKGSINFDFLLSSDGFEIDSKLDPLSTDTRKNKEKSKFSVDYEECCKIIDFEQNTKSKISELCDELSMPTKSTTHSKMSELHFELTEKFPNKGMVKIYDNKLSSGSVDTNQNPRKLESWDSVYNLLDYTNNLKGLIELESDVFGDINNTEN